MGGPGINAAYTYLLQWGRGLKTPEMLPQTAETWRPPLLQWGRGLKTPEITVQTGALSCRCQLQWGRGLKTPEMPAAKKNREFLKSFNGAGVLRPRK